MATAALIAQNLCDNARRQKKEQLLLKKTYDKAKRLEIIATCFLKNKSKPHNIIMTNSRLIYENLAIGIIAQRIGECRYANKYFVNVRMMVTQQIRKLEEKYRDAILSIEDKLLVIEFKAPKLTTNYTLKYENVNLDKLKKIAELVGGENVMIALIHVALPNQEVRNAKSTGTYLWLATPGTTTFIPLEQVLPYANSGNVDIEVLEAINSVNINYVNTLVPTCAKQTHLVKREPWCASCGGLYMGLTQTRKVVLKVQIIQKSTVGNIQALMSSYTLASLIREFVKCKIGCIVKETLQRQYNELIELFTPRTTMFTLSKRGLFLISPVQREYEE